jgi:hypothetical protein
MTHVLVTLLDTQVNIEKTFGTEDDVNAVVAYSSIKSGTVRLKDE